MIIIIILIFVSLRLLIHGSNLRAVLSIAHGHSKQNHLLQT